MSESNIRVAILGASGYTSLESIVWLSRHPAAELAMVCSRRDPQPRMHELFPQLAGRCELLCEAIDVDAVARRADVALLCLPQQVSMQYAGPLLSAGVKVVDFSADYRLKDPVDYRQNYKAEHIDLANLEIAVYGIPECFREQIRHAKLVANPGCHPTAALLAIAPLVRAKLIELDDVLVSSMTGISGAGRTPRPEHYFPERNETVEPYNVGTHRHMIEIQRTLDVLAHGQQTEVVFTPYLVPMERGILSTACLKPKQHISIEHLTDVYQKAYADEPFVRFSPDLPSTKNTARSNFCDLAVRVVKSRVIAFSAIDNMVKGAAGQAIQNMNLMFGLDETTGLRA
jgi:N-acetyl-gamma-glutamyl-phosphate reductase